jgi:hypothetical protein
VAVIDRHGSAGPVLPVIAAAAPVPVAGMVFVDAALPRPGRSWFDDAPAELRGWLREHAAWRAAAAVNRAVPSRHRRSTAR